jgi:carbon-monoxide dehydrogenase large subunit
MSVIGQPVERIEDLRLLRGRGQFVDDLHRDGMLHAAMLRSSVAHGRIVTIETKAAKAMPGVRAIFTAQDLSGGTDSVPMIPLRLAPLPELEKFEQPVIAHHEVRYVGEPIAVVVADTLAQAEDALEAIDLDIEPLPVAADRRAGELAITYAAVKGNALSIEAPYMRRERFSVQRHTAV